MQGEWCCLHLQESYIPKMGALLRDRFSAKKSMGKKIKVLQSKVPKLLFLKGNYTFLLLFLFEHISLQLNWRSFLDKQWNAFKEKNQKVQLSFRKSTFGTTLIWIIENLLRHLGQIKSYQITITILYQASRFH